ncbi:MAG: hypothetical protein HZB65_04250 [Candidatus Aenigmarchaeota archaeon]|nr:hypothetical protein [Candidatus Aenigmarchaeota archaeon]
MENRYWRDIGLGFVILMAAVILLVIFYKPVIPDGFNEQRCMANFDNYADVSRIELQSIRNGAILDKQAMAAGNNGSIFISLKSNRYEGFLESCEMTLVTQKPVLTQRPDIVLLCDLGDIRMSYDAGDNSIIQEIKLSSSKRAGFLKEFMNFTVLSNLSNNYSASQNSYNTQQAGYDTDDALGEDIHQTYVLYVNPELDDVYAEKADAFIDSARILRCSGEIPQDFIELSRYRAVIDIG